MSLLYIFLIFFSYTSVTLSDAIAKNGDKAETVGWQPDPNGRGTFTLVSSCVLTLIICVYSAMHLNVPPRHESIIQFWVRNIRWALLGIFGPELVVFIAWKQYLSAKSLVRRAQREPLVRKKSWLGGLFEKPIDLESTERPSTYRETPPWTLVHGFYAGMGGFTFQINDSTTKLETQIFDLPVCNTDCKRLTLTARGVALLADCNLLPDIERQFLDDKSKSDGLSKLIACLQAVWLIVQVVGGLILGLQITLLEINTLGHVFCALVIYILWWHKPRMVLEPIALHGDWVGPLYAYMYMSSSISGHCRATARGPKGDWTQPEISSITFRPEEPCKHIAHTTEDCREIAIRRTSYDTSSSAEQDARPDESPCPQSDTRPRIVKGATPQDLTNGSFFPRLAPPSFVKDDLSAEQLLRWGLAAKAVCTYPAIKSRFTPIEDIDASGRPTGYLEETQPEELVEEYCSNWATQGLLPGDYGLVMGMALWFASMAFGGIHAVAWHEHFPSRTESWLWRISALYIIWSGLVWLLINMVAKLSQRFNDYWDHVRLYQPPFVTSRLLIVVCSLCGLLYTFARLYLVIEAFISIRKLPASAYQTPDWTQVIPHL